jgi:type I restriction enzyme R subunit
MTRGVKRLRCEGLALRLRRARKESGLKASQLSQRAGLSQRVVSFIEREGQVPAIDTLALLARVLGRSPCWLAFGEGQGIPAEEDPGIAGRLLLARQARGMSRNALGLASGTSDVSVIRIEAGEVQPRLDTVEKLAAALDVSPGWLAWGVDPEAPRAAAERTPMGLNEADTRAKLIDPALHRRGWNEDLIHREETAGPIEVIGGIARQRARGRIDYTLRIQVNPQTQPVAVALIEAKAEGLPPDHGLEQAKGYCRRGHVPFAYASNGHLFVEFDATTGLTSAPRPLSDFPTPAELRARYEAGAGFSLTDPAAAPLLCRYPGGEATRRYYQDAAIRAVLEKIARGARTGQPPRALLSLATGSGKTRIAVFLLRRFADAGQVRRALFVCDRDELRSQAIAAFQGVFGNDAVVVSSEDPGKNGRVLIATYQTLDVDSEDATANFFSRHYPPDHFSHIIIDECHRSAWGKWSQILLKNPRAVQIGLTATPRQLAVPEQTKEAQADAQVTADNLRYFGEPVYEYDMSQGMEDGYLAACEIIRRDIFLDGGGENERERGVARGDLEGKELTDSLTGESVGASEARPHYGATSFEDRLLLPDRVQAMAEDLFQHLIDTGGPEQKTILFCARDRHAEVVAEAMNNLYAAYCAKEGRARAEPYAFRCTSRSGSDYLGDLRGAGRAFFVATTVDLLTTGVDVPAVRNIVFFKYVRSPIAFYQMVGRGTRLDATSGKLMFRVYDYTNATRLFGAEFRSRHTARPAPRGPSEERPAERQIQVVGFDVRITDAGRYLVTMVDGRAMPVTIEEYKERLSARLLLEAPTIEALRGRWVVPAQRRSLLAGLPDGGRGPVLVQQMEQMDAYDLYDVLAELGYGALPRTRQERAEAFRYKHAEWLAGLPEKAAATLRALADQFGRGGIEELERPEVFQTPAVKRAGGIKELQALGRRPADVLRETKERLLAA